MTDPIRPIRPVSGVSRLLPVSAASRDRPDEAQGAGDLDQNLPAPTVTPVVEALEPQRVSETVYAAQVMGQGGQKRGLRGGRETLDRARSTYLETEYSGPADRRIARGRITKTEV
jgi:hypothetical protein